MILAVGTVESVTVTTHTAMYTLHDAPFVDCGFYYYPGVRMRPHRFEMIWTDNNEPYSVTIEGRRTDNGHLARNTYAITQAPKWLYDLLQEHFAEKNWKILPPEAVHKQS